MILDTLFSLAFLSQVIVLSFYWPRVVATRLEPSTASRSNAKGDEAPTEARLVRYSFASHSLIPLGLGLLAMFLWLPTFELLEATLLAIGLYFFLQLSPLTLVKGHLASQPRPGSAPPSAEETPHTIRLASVVSPMAIGIAGAMLLAYGIPQLVLSGGVWGPQLLKVLILAGANAFFAAILATNLHRLRRVQGKEWRRRYSEFQKAAPMLVYISIGLTVYFVGKDVIFAVGVPRLRLIMMTVFLQLLGSLAFSRLIGSRTSGAPSRAT